MDIDCDIARVLDFRALRRESTLNSSKPNTSAVRMMGLRLSAQSGVGFDGRNNILSAWTLDRKPWVSTSEALLYVVPSDASTEAEHSVEQYKLFLRRRLSEADVLDESAIDRMDIIMDLVRLMATLSRDFEGSHRPLGATWAGYRLLKVLWVCGDLEPGLLASLSGTSRASVSSALNTLESRGYIKRSVNAANRRRVDVTLTNKGREAMPRAIVWQSERELQWFKVLSDEEQATFAKLLNRLVEQSPPAPSDIEEFHSQHLALFPPRHKAWTTEHPA